MVMVTMLYEGIDSLARILEPYNLLQQGYHTTSQAMTEDCFRQTAAVLVPRSLLRKRFALAVAAVAVSLGPVLTIAVSGLYTANAVLYTHDIDLHQLDTFNVINLQSLVDVWYGEGIADGAAGTEHGATRPAMLRTRS